MGEIVADLENFSSTLDEGDGVCPVPSPSGEAGDLHSVVQRIVALAKEAEANYHDRLFVGDAWDLFQKDVFRLLHRNQATSSVQKT